MVVVLSTWESSRRGGDRVAVRLELTPRGRQSRGYDSSAQLTGARTSGIVEMLGPELLVYEPAAL